MNKHREFKLNKKKKSVSGRSKGFEAGTKIVISFAIHFGEVIKF